MDFTKSNKSRLRVIDTCSLGNRQFLAVAQYEKDRHLLAISNAGFHILLQCGPIHPTRFQIQCINLIQKLRTKVENDEF